MLFRSALLMIFAGTLVTFTVGARATRALARSHQELEDIVEARTSELKDNNKRTESIINTASDGIIVVDSDGVIQQFSPAAEAIFGFESDEIVGNNVDAILDPPFHMPVKTPEEYPNIKGDDIIEIKGERKDGSQFDAEVAVGDAVLDNQHLYTGMVRDVTERKQAERELTQAKVTAEEATQAKSDFLANMSHEIRTPMNAIIGMSYLALQTDLSRRQKDYVDKIHHSANSLLGIINDILDFSKIEAGKLDIEMAPFDLAETLDHIVQMVSIKSKQKGIELLIDMPANLPTNLIGDSLRLGQILINLANNAVKFTETGEIVIKIQAIEQTKSNTKLQFSIKDTGIGMTEKQVEKLFTSFSQADASTTRKYGGTGLGLTISKSLTQLMGGEIWVESEYEKGSTFSFTACFDLSEENSQARKRSDRNLSGLRVLVVDDSVAAREILQGLSNSLGFETDSAVSGEEALEKVRSANASGSPIDIVFSDWKMPKMDGVELSRAIHELALAEAHPKIVLVTAYDKDELVESAEGIPIDGYITKPVTASTLLETAQYALGARTDAPSDSSSHGLSFEAAQQIQGAHILLVEDNEINVQIATELLEMAGFVITVAVNGQEAIDILDSQTFDAVLMDVQMPVMDGYTATIELRKDAKFDSLPIIAMTANAMAGDREKCLEVGMNDHLAKPIEPEEVFSTLAKWIEPRTSSDAPAPTVKQDHTPLPDIEGLDVERAVARVGGSVKVFVKMLSKVTHSQADAIERIESSLDSADWLTAERDSHTLKGIAGNIGANDLAAHMADVESYFSALSKGERLHSSDELSPLLAKASSLLDQCLSAIASALGANVDNSPKDDANREIGRASCRERVCMFV